MTKRISAVKPKAEAALVCWIDHSEPINRKPWEMPTLPAQLSPLVVWSAGFVTSENDEQIELSRDCTEHGTVGGPVFILKRCIVYRRRIRVPAARRERG